MDIEIIMEEREEKIEIGVKPVNIQHVEKQVVYYHADDGKPPDRIDKAVSFTLIRYVIVYLHRSHIFLKNRTIIDL